MKVKLLFLSLFLTFFISYNFIKSNNGATFNFSIMNSGKITAEQILKMKYAYIELYNKKIKPLPINTEQLISLSISNDILPSNFSNSNIKGEPISCTIDSTIMSCSSDFKEINNLFFDSLSSYLKEDNPLTNISINNSVISIEFLLSSDII